MKDIYYFIAIGGVGMSGLAKYLLEEGYEVSGSDLKSNKNIERLQKMGANVFIGEQKAEHLPEKCIVVVSSAIRNDNPEMVKAHEMGFAVLHRSDLLAKISRGLIGEKKKYFLGYSGTHGKTTTSGLSSYVLEKAGLKPSFVVGGTIPEVGTNAKADSGDFLVAELDESDGTIVKYRPEISIINNIEKDHVDFYKDGLNSLLKTFSTYLNSLPDNAKVIVNNDNEGTKKLQEANENINFITFGLDKADYVAKNIKFKFGETTFDIFYKGKFLITLKTQLFGTHNVYNAMAVLASLHQAGVDIEAVKEHFYTFTGMGRRFQLAAKFDGICVYDDYAHHPSEIKATLSGLKPFKDKRLIVVFQPHRYSRLQGLWNDFLNAFDNVDKVYVTDVFAASEDPIEGVNSKRFELDLENKGISCKYLAGGIDEVAKALLPDLKENDVVIGLGAGTITILGKELLTSRKGVKI